jgi:hypothetical protein
MQRRPNTDASGKPFEEEVIEAVWQKARAMGTSAILRVDAWGWTIVRQDYGNIRSRYGWEIDHVIPVAQGGDDELINLQPLQWENNRRKDEIQGMTTTAKASSQTHRPEAASSPTAQKKRH